MKKLVKSVKLNNLEYNPNRDPQVYRNVPNEKFRLQAWLDGSGSATVTLREANGPQIATGTVSLPGIWTHEISYPSAGIRVVTLDISAGAEKFSRDLRLDVMEEAWHG
jgi:hypothetical protein